MKKYPIKQQIIFCKTLALLLGSGVPVMKALDIVNAPEKMKAQVRSGGTLSQAMSFFFNREAALLCSLGETSAQLDKTLLSAASELERKKKFREQLTGSLSYPAVVLLMSLVSIAVFACVILPQVSSVSSSMGISQPFMVTALLFFFERMLPFTAAVLALSMIMFFYFNRGRSGEPAEKIVLAFPVIGRILKRSSCAKIARASAVLIGAGVPFSRAIGEVVFVTRSSCFKNALERIRVRVESGSGISDAFAKEQLMDRTLTELINAGEEAGDLELMLNAAADILEDDTWTAVKTLAGAAEPLATVLVGVFVGFSVLTMFSPILKIMSSL